MAPIAFGILAFDYQSLDVFGPTDLLNCSSKKLLRALGTMVSVDEAIIDRAPEFVFHHIGVTRNLVPLHSSSPCINIVPSASVDDCPELDCLLVGGPGPTNFELHPKQADFIRRHVKAGKLLFTTCTGAAVVASTGVLDGKNATVNNMVLQFVKQKYPKVMWTNERKWVIDGNIWTGGGASAGMDMFAHWIKENFGLDVLTHGASILDFEPRDIDGHMNIIQKRYDDDGKQIFTHGFNPSST